MIKNEQVIKMDRIPTTQVAQTLAEYFVNEVNEKGIDVRNNHRTEEMVADFIRQWREGIDIPTINQNL